MTQADVTAYIRARSSNLRLYSRFLKVPQIERNDGLIKPLLMSPFATEEFNSPLIKPLMSPFATEEFNSALNCLGGRARADADVAGFADGAAHTQGADLKYMNK